MILYGQEGLKKYSSNEISKSALGKNHPSAHCTWSHTASCSNTFTLGRDLEAEVKVLEISHCNVLYLFIIQHSEIGLKCTVVYLCREPTVWGREGEVSSSRRCWLDTGGRC